MEFLTNQILSWCKKKKRNFCSRTLFIHDNAPCHAAKNTMEHLAAMGIKGEKLTVWPPSAPHHNPIENLSSILMQKIYEGGRQFTSPQLLWRAFLTSSKESQSETLQQLTSSMDARIVRLISKKGSRAIMHFGLLQFVA